MAESYDFKVIKSGKEIEIYDYKDKTILRGYKRKKRKEKKEKKKGKRKKTPAGTEEKEYAFDEIQQAKLIIEFK